jgi:hypothetical protein
MGAMVAGHAAAAAPADGADAARSAPALERLAQRRSEEPNSLKVPQGPSSEPGGLPGARPELETRSPVRRGAAPASKEKGDKGKKKDGETGTTK